MKLVQNIKSTVSELRECGFNTPRKGQEITLKSFLAYCCGGMGMTTLFGLFSYMTLTANCLLIGSVYGIKPTDLAIMAIIVNIFSLVKAPIVSMIVDNTNTKYGKFRPYLLITGIPTALLIIAMTFIPTNIGYYPKCAFICVTYLFLFTFQSIYKFAYQGLGQTMTSNTNERGTLLSLSQFIGNLAPSILNLILPIVAGIISKEENGMLDINTYRIIFPIFTAFGVLMTIWTFKDTKENIIVPKDYVAKVGFKEGLSHISKNKYFWIISIAEIFAELRVTVGFVFLGWYCVYMLNSDTMLGIVSTVMGTAAVPGMLLAPIIAKKIGKRNFILIGYALHAIAALMMAVCFGNQVLFFIFMYLCILATGGDYVTQQALWADVFDYQQYKTGKRLEAFMLQCKEFIYTFFGFATVSILPFLYEHFGLKTDYSVLYTEEVRTPVFLSIIFVTAISTVLSAIPYLFFDLNTKKHKEIIEELKVRAEKESVKSSEIA